MLQRLHLSRVGSHAEAMQKMIALVLQSTGGNLDVK